jgi:capsular polysaccharide biosynthesis protein
MPPQEHTLFEAGLAALAPKYAKSRIPLLDGDKYIRKEPFIYPLSERQFVPPVYFYEFDDVIVEKNGVLILGGSIVVAETAVDFPRNTGFDLGDIRFEKESRKWMLNSERPIESFECPALLLIKHGFNNYGHWLVEILPKLKLALEHLPDDAVIAVGQSEGRMWEVTLDTLAVLGIDPGRVRTVSGLSRFRKLYYVSPLTLHSVCISPYVIRFLNEVYKPKAIGRACRRLYVSRSDARFRRLLNEYDVLDYLLPLGFEVIHPGQMSFEAQVRCFSEAELVVGVAGAAMTNIVFAPPGIPVIALHPSTMKDPFFWELAGLNNQHYYEVSAPEFGQLGSLYADFVLNLDDVGSVLERAGIDVFTKPSNPEGMGHSNAEQTGRHDVACDAAVALYCPQRSAIIIRGLKSGKEFELGVEMNTRQEGWIPLFGDWDGDGIAGFGIYVQDQGVFGLRNRIEEGAPDYLFPFRPHEKSNLIPLMGDWNGNGVPTVGLYDPSESIFFLASRPVSDITDFVVFRFGPAGAEWLPLSGDWDGDGVDSVGLYDPHKGFFYLLTDLNKGGTADLVFQFGPTGPGMVPIAGKWDNSGESSVGLYNERTGEFMLRCARGAHARFYSFGQNSGKAFPFVLKWPPDPVE